jgi:hypothetical protein
VKSLKISHKFKNKNTKKQEILYNCQDMFEEIKHQMFVHLRASDFGVS